MLCDCIMTKLCEPSFENQHELLVLPDNDTRSVSRRAGVVVVMWITMHFLVHIFY